MKRISISDAVWQEIAKRGAFGESEDDVLRRVFELEPREAGAPPLAGRRGRGSVRHAQKRMSARVERGSLIVEFPNDDVRRQWKLAGRDDKEALRTVRAEAVDFALQNGASDPGQTNAVRKALTDAGYHLTK